jgi:signal transduction protein with GAF and PtsI domain
MWIASCPLTPDGKAFLWCSHGYPLNRWRPHRSTRDGAMSHAAIVAREYDIPAVMGTADGATRLEDGQRVCVDGTRGLVIAR